MTLQDYNHKRNFSETPEPKGEKKFSEGPLRFVVQLHHASRIHYDFRLEAGGVFNSWAVPKGPSLRVQDQRLAVWVEDHPIEYGSFEGIIPPGNYGAGTVMIWDQGDVQERSSSSREESEASILKGIESGHITFILYGEKLKGEFALIRIKEKDPKSWLLVKKRDEFASHRDVTLEVHSVKTGRTIQEIAAQSGGRGDVWLPKRTQSVPVQPLYVPKLISPKPEPSSPPTLQPMTTLEKLPRKNKPMLFTPFAEPFDQEGWLFELDRGGVRALAEVERNLVHLYSRQLLPFEKKYPKLVQALRDTKITAVLDGEIVTHEGSDPIFWVRDLLHLEGQNTRVLPLLERKALLKKLNLFSDLVRYCTHTLGESTSLISKNGDQKYLLARDAYSSYRSGTSKLWLKIPINEKADKTDSQKFHFSHLDKVYWPDPAGPLTKGDLVEYYRKIAPVLLPHLAGRPQSLHRFPDGITSPGFFQKDLSGHHPKWVFTERIFSESSDRSIDYLLCQNEATLLYMANLGCIELNPWLSRVGCLDQPDFVVIDLDPDEHPFSEVVKVANQVHEILSSISVYHLVKTSGATGLHIFIPVGAQVDYETGRGFALAVCQVVQSLMPTITTLERSPAKRRRKLYLDCFQNARGQTVASVYSVRPHPKAPVSTPLLWEEMTPALHPEQFTLLTVPERVQRLGDLWRPMLENKVDLVEAISRLREKFPKSRSNSSP